MGKTFFIAHLYQNNNAQIFNHLVNLEYMKAQAFKGMDSSSTVPPVQELIICDHYRTSRHCENTSKLQTTNWMKHTTLTLGLCFAVDPSNLSSQCKFNVMQIFTHVRRFFLFLLKLDDIMNLLNYPMFYHFTSATSSLPHEYHK